MVNHSNLEMVHLQKLIITEFTKEQLWILIDQGRDSSNSGHKSPHLLVAINSHLQALMVQEFELNLNSQYGG